MQGKYNRRKFLRWTANLTLLPAVLVWYKLVEKEKLHSGMYSDRHISHDALTEKVNFMDGIIAIKDKDHENISFFSSKCPHLGCNISKYNDGKIICPCHGSEYDLNGKVLKGPASGGLKPLDYIEDKIEKKYIVSL